MVKKFVVEVILEDGGSYQQLIAFQENLLLLYKLKWVI
jgi:hypothetical protein